VASLIACGGQSVHYQLHITFLMLTTKNYKHVFEFDEVIIWNTLSFFTLEMIKTTFSMTS